MTRHAIIEVKPIDTKVPKQAMNKATAILDNVKEIVVTNQAQYEYCANALKDVKTMSKTVDTERRKITVPIDVAKKAAQELFRKPKEALETAEKILKGAMIAYTDEQGRKRQEAQRKLDQEAEKKRLEKERQQREWEAKEREKREEAERLEAEGKEEEAAKARTEAEKAATKAEERVEEKEAVVAPVIAKEETSSGISYRMKYTGEVFNFEVLPDTYKIVNQGMLDKTIQAQKGVVPIPGVKIRTQKIVVAGGR